MCTLQRLKNETFPLEPKCRNTCIYPSHKLLEAFLIMIDFSQATGLECTTTKLLYLDVGDQALTKQQVHVVELMKKDLGSSSIPLKH